MATKGLSMIIGERAEAALSADLPGEVVERTKLLILDSIGCILGSLDAPAAGAIRGALDDLGHPDGVTLVGTGREGDVGTGILYNGALLRFLDMNDVQTSDVAPGPRHGHNSEFLTPILALAEHGDLGGYDVIKGLSFAYDISTGFTEGVQGRSLEDRGWDVDLRAAIAMPAVAGSLLGLSSGEIANAIGISASRCGVLNVLDNGVDDNAMAKNLRFPLTAYVAVQSTFLARAGLTGPARALEGKHGVIDTVLNGEFDPVHLEDRFRSHRIMDAAIKAFAACYATHGHLTATTTIADTHGFSPESVRRVRIRTTSRTVEHTAHPDRRHPSNKETADHSTHYVTAVALVDHVVGVRQFSADKLRDPVINSLCDKVDVIADASLDPQYPAAEVTVSLDNGEELTELVLFPKGHPKNPLTDQEVERKFLDMAVPALGDHGAEEVLDTVRSLESVPRISQLMALLAVRQ